MITGESRGTPGFRPIHEQRAGTNDHSGWGLVSISQSSLTTIPLHDGAVLGSNPSALNAICLDEPSISAEHCKFTVREDGAYIETLGAGAETWVDAVPVGTVGLAHGSVVRVGSSLFLFVERELSSYAGTYESLGSDVVFGPRQRGWVSAAMECVRTGQGLVIGGPAGVGKAALARACMAAHGHDVDLEILDAAHPEWHDRVQVLAVSGARRWLVLHVNALSPVAQAELVRAVRRTPGASLVATVVHDSGDSRLESLVSSSLAAFVSHRHVVIPSLDDRREDIVAIARGIAARDGIPARRIGVEVIEQLTRGGWNEGVRQLSTLLRAAFVGVSEEPLGLSWLRRRIARRGPVIPLPLPLADPDLARARVFRALDQASGTVAVAARRLGVSRQSFYREVRRLGVSLRPST